VVVGQGNPRIYVNSPSKLAHSHRRVQFIHNRENESHVEESRHQGLDGTIAVSREGDRSDQDMAGETAAATSGRFALKCP
jgi:hypothetical protein